MRGDPTFWILARASGLLAYLLLTIATLAGLFLKSRPFGRALRPATVTEIHRSLALFALGAIGLHGAALTLDRVVPIPLAALLVPGLSPYRPLAVAPGVLAAELMLAVYLSFPLRRRIGVRSWRRLHWASYAIFAAATAHGLAAGSDSGRGWVFALYTAAVAAVIAATVWRTLVQPRKPATRQRPRAAEQPLAARSSA